MKITDELAQTLVDHFADVAEGRSDELACYNDLDAGYIAGRKSAAGAIRAELTDIGLSFPFWTTDLPAALTAAPVAAPVQVKSLEWGNLDTIKTVVGRYEIEEMSSFEFSLTRDDLKVSTSRTREAAKAAAQADYEQRIRSALVTAPSRDDVVSECIEAIVLAPKQGFSANYEEGWRQAIYAATAALRSLISGDTSND